MSEIFWDKKIIDDEYWLNIQRRLKNKEITISDLSDEELDGMIILYQKQIREKNAILRNCSRQGAAKGKQVKTTLIEGRKFDQLYFEESLSEIGLSLFIDKDYLGTYLSYTECLCDLAFFYSFTDFEMFVDMFDANGSDTQSPFRYRGVYTELQKTDNTLVHYVHYSSTLQDLINKFDFHEKRAKKSTNNERFEVECIKIYLFDENHKKYSLWIDLEQAKSVVEIIHFAHEKQLFIPEEALSELSKAEDVEVFISHKSEDYLASKKIYDHLLSHGIPTFLSEISLPAMSNSDYSFEIDKALEKAKSIIVIATSLENITSSWVQYEWSTFANEKRSGRKTGNIITLISNNLSIDELPLVLRQHEVIRLENYKEVINYI